MIPRLALPFLIAIVCASAQTTLFHDDFSGSSSSDLHGTVPDIRPGSETWISATGASGWKADGSATGTAYANSFLAFTPEAGRVYTLSLSANPQGTNDGWFALGFSASASVDTFYATNPPQPAAWLLLRSNRADPSSTIQTFLGPGTSNSASFDEGTGYVVIGVELDTTSELWSVRWFADGNTLRTASYSTSNPAINYLAFGKYGDAVGSVDDFTLTVSAIPEPATTVLAVALLATVAVPLTRHNAARRSAPGSG